jgi:beta-lactamase regulating signal transducer with metallopeptidase domain
VSAPLAGLESFFGGLLTASWQASVLALLVLGLQGALGARLNPRWRYALWLLVLVRLLLPFQVESAVSLFQFAPAPLAAFTAPMTQPLFLAAPISPASVTERLIASPPDSPSLSLFSILALVWLVGVAILGVLTFEINRRFARHIAASPEVTDPVILTLFGAARMTLGTRRSVRLIESAQVGSPAIMGLFRPTLLLPARVRETFDLAELRLIFLHELAHLKRGDVIAQGLIALLQVLHWFNPVLWFAFRRMRADREPAADALVLSRAGEGEKERYGLMLLKLLEHFHHRHALPTLVGILEDKDPFKRRFQLIARYTRGAYGWSTLGLLIIGAIAAVGLTTPAAPSSLRPMVAAAQNTGGVVSSTSHVGSPQIKVSVIITGKALKDWAQVNFKVSEIDTPTVSRLDLGSTTIPDGGTGQLNSVHEFPYPTDFDPPKQRNIELASGKKVIALIPMWPYEFVTTPVGWSIQLIPNLDKGEILLQGSAAFKDAVMQNGSGVYGDQTKPIYGNFTDPKTGKSSRVLLPAYTGSMPVFTQSQTPFFVFCQPGRDYDIRLQYGSDWVTATVRCELEAAAASVATPLHLATGPGLETQERNLFKAQQDADKRRVLYDSTIHLSDAEFVATLEGMERAPSNLVSLQSDVLRQEDEEKSLLAQGFGSHNPRVEAVDAQLASEQSQYGTLIKGVRNALKIDAAMAASGVVLLQTQVDELKAAAK